MLDKAFWDAFEKEAARREKFKPNFLLERIRRGLPLRLKGHSTRGISKTRLGKVLRSLK